MKPLKICVYAICKNEEIFIDRWVDSMSEADHILVLDTGSTDQSLARLQARGVEVHQAIIDPWRFDVARNMALNLVPNDVDLCLSSDLDEVLLPGWYEHLQTHWQDDATGALCRFVCNYHEDGSEGGVFWPLRIHKRHDYIWTHAIHEVLTYSELGSPKVITIPHMQFIHYPDANKPRPYLKLLEAAVKQNPTDSRDHFYLGREYMYYQHWEKCIHTLEKYLTLPTSTWNEERSAALRYMARSYLNQNQKENAILAFERAAKEAPHLREPLIELANLYYHDQAWQQVAALIDQALLITTSSTSFVNEGHAWDATPYDIGSIAHYHLGHIDLALVYALKALEFSPNNARIQANITFYQQHIISSYASSTSSS